MAKQRARRGRGEGSIFQRADGRWAATISVGYTDAGRRRRKTVYGPSKKSVQDKLKALDAEAVISDPGRLTVGEYLDRWLSQAVKPTTAPATHRRYRVSVEHQIKPYLGGLRLTAVRPLHVEQLYRSLSDAGCSPRVQQLAGATISRALGHAVRLRLLPYNPARDIPKAKVPEREIVCWNREQADQFLTATKIDRLHALYVLALATGMRQGELFALTWPDVDLKVGAVTVRRSLEELGGALRVKETKTGKGRRVELPAFAVSALAKHQAAMLAEGHIAGPVFCDSSGGHLRKGNVLRRSFWPAIARAEVPRVTFHSIRHCHATLLLQAGENVKVVSERLGHAKVAITLQTYAHALPGMGRSAADRMDSLFGTG